MYLELTEGICKLFEYKSCVDIKLGKKDNILYYATV